MVGDVQADQKKVEKKLARSLASQNLPARTRAQRQVGTTNMYLAV
jgi:hypothetical protein